jgi:hypothetical protein
MFRLSPKEACLSKLCKVGSLPFVKTIDTGSGEPPEHFRVVTKREMDVPRSRHGAGGGAWGHGRMGAGHNRPYLG